MPTVPAPDEQWIRLLSDHGLGILVTCFCLFAIVPAIGWGVWQVIRWLGNNFKEFAGHHYRFLDQTGRAIDAISDTQRELKDLFAQSGLLNSTWHDEKINKLESIHDGVQTLHEKVDDIRNHLPVPRRTPHA